jgi:oligopeptide/dipeptide ABC transporter ATP-binding protein
MKILEVKNLRTHFPISGGRVARAVDGVSFDVNKGESVCIVGESGCGKSVTAFSILQLLPRKAFHPSGEILFRNKNILSMTVQEKRSLRGRKVAMIFQEPGTALNPVFRVGPQVAEIIRIHEKVSKLEARIRTVELFRRVGIPLPDVRFEAWPHELSGGMKQRVMIAMALACKPELLIADEPTTALDVTIQAQILKLMLELRKENNMSILMITHNLRVVNQMADRVVVMYGGKVVETATREELFSNPSHPYTRSLLRAIPAVGLRGKELTEIPGRVPPATDFPDFCRFSARCSDCFAECKEKEPPLLTISPQHQAACFLHKEQTHE